MAQRSLKSDAVKNRRLQASKAKQYRVLQIQSLEKREVPAIALIGAEVTVTAGDFNDAVLISTQVVNGQSMITARRTETRTTPLGTTLFNESQSFPAARVSSVRATLGNGNNSFTNDTSLPSIVSGGTGTDVMYGGSGKDAFSGFGGSDRLFGKGGPDSLLGGDSLDHLEGGDGDDIILGGASNDTILGGLGNDIISGEDGDDKIQGGIGIDNLFGGAGNDIIAGDVFESEGLLDDANTISGGDGDDALFGAAKIDTISGNAGNDQLFGMGGADVLNGNDDDDRVFGGQGNDLINGGAGDDWLDGDDGNDEIHGGDGADRIHGDLGADKLFGELGRDTIIGGQGADLMVGGEDIDTIIGVDGVADTIMAGTTLSTTVRDELWIDPQDSSTNLGAVTSVKAIDAKAVHVVQEYRTYTVNGQSIVTPLTLGVPMVDPLPRAVDMSVTNEENINLPLFSSAGPQYTDIDQGSVGSCYFLARLASLAKTHPQYIRDMVVDLGDGTYAVQFFFQNGAKTYVRVDNSLYQDPGANRPKYTDLGADNSMWAAIIEKAWAIHRYGTNASYDDIAGGNSEQTNTSVALGLNQIDTIPSSLPNAASFVSLIQNSLAMGRTVLLPAPASLSDSTPMTETNKERGTHVYMVHSVVTNAQGAPTKVLLYNLYGDPLIEITNFDMLYWCAAKAAVAWPM